MLSIASIPSLRIVDRRPTLTLELELVDPEVVTELRRHPEGPLRQDFAKAALRVGVLALRQAQGSIDSDLVRRQMEGSLARLEEAVDGALAQQRQRLLREFSLDDPSSALYRMVREVGSNNGDLRDGLKEDLDDVCREFSLDNHRGALSRLRHEILNVVADLSASNDEFQHEVRSTLEKMQVRRDEAARSTRHGIEFELALGELLMLESQSHDELLDACGLTTGRIPRSKKGDFVLTLGREAAAAGARIVVEAKEQRVYTVGMALAEIEDARRNRDAGVGVFVFSKRTAPTGLQVVSRHGQDILVVWDQDDPESDVYVRVALSLARALSTRRNGESRFAAEFGEIDDAMLRIGRRAEDLEQIVTWAKTIENNGLKIRSKGETIKSELEEQLARLVRNLEGFRDSRE